jgi:quercetin dioxygenase-like cupin family protein
MSTEELKQFAARLAADRHRWQHLVRHNDDTRVYEQIWDSEEVNAWVICWSEEQDTGFHDHDESAAAILVIEGRVREERLRLGAAPEGRVGGPGTTLFVPPTAIHRVLHAGEGPAITIHAYSPPLTRTGAYRLGPGGELERTSLPYEAELRAEPALT